MTWGLFISVIGAAGGISGVISILQFLLTHKRINRKVDVETEVLRVNTHLLLIGPLQDRINELETQIKKMTSAAAQERKISEETINNLRKNLQMKEYEILKIRNDHNLWA